MIRIYFFALVICSGVLLPITAEVISLHPNQAIQEHAEGEEFGVFCDVKSADNLQWLNPNGQVVSDKRPSLIFVEKVQHMLQLRFQPLKTSHAGVYTCVARISGVDQKKTFTLNVIRPITFSDKLREYHALLGSSQILYCEVESNPASIISWTFKDAIIEGDDFKILEDGLQVNNVTEEKLGNYTCTASLTTNNNGISKSINITLKQAIPPQIISIYKNNTVHGIYNNVVSIRCPVVADPWPEIKWIRGNRELNSPQYNANITTTPNGSVLQFVLSSPDLLGSYTCKAANSFNSTFVTFTLEEGDLPFAPMVHVRDTQDKALRLDITSNSSQDLSNYRVLIKKSSEDESHWKTLDFGLKDSPTNPFSINDLEPNTDYIYKVGACSQDDLCAFTNVTKITTQPLAASSTNTIHTVVTQAFILLPAFILGLMQRHRTT